MMQRLSALAALVSACAENYCEGSDETVLLQTAVGNTRVHKPPTGLCGMPDAFGSVNPATVQDAMAIFGIACEGIYTRAFCIIIDNELFAPMGVPEAEWDTDLAGHPIFCEELAALITASNDQLANAGEGVGHALLSRALLTKHDAKTNGVDSLEESTVRKMAPEGDFGIDVAAIDAYREDLLNPNAAQDAAQEPTRVFIHGEATTNPDGSDVPRNDPGCTKPTITNRYNHQVYDARWPWSITNCNTGDPFAMCMGARPQPGGRGGGQYDVTSQSDLDTWDAWAARRTTNPCPTQ